MFKPHRLVLLVTVLVAVPAYAQDDLPLLDPLRPYEPAASPIRGDIESAPQRLLLTAVLVSASRRVAVINGAIHREGEWIEGAQITRIEAGSVRMRRGKEDFVISLAQERKDSALPEGDSAS